MKILVTGAAGYLGSFLSKKLSSMGHTVLAYDNMSTGHSENLQKSLKFVLGDVRDSNLMGRVLKDNGIECVIHAAGLIQASESVEKPDLYLDHNMIGTMRTLEACHRAQVQNFIFASSASVYGKGSMEKASFFEAQNLTPVHPYGKSKKMAEEIIQTLSAPFGIRSVILRIFNLAGASDDLQCGTRGPSHLLIPRLMAALSQKTPLNVFGDGSQVRDYVHIEDVGRAFEKSLNYLSKMKNPSAEIFNVGTGEGTSVQSMIRDAEKISELKLNWEPKSSREFDPVELVSDQTRTESLLGWSPEKSRVDILTSAWKWENLRK